MCQIYYAKSVGEDGKQQKNRRHLEQVAALAEHFGEEIGMPLAAWICGLLHDFGKYSVAFQRVLAGTATGIDHAICGAVFLYAAKLKKRGTLAYRMAAAAIAAHHSALRSYDSLVPELEDLLTGVGPGICATGKRAALFGQEEYLTARAAFLHDFPNFYFRKLERADSHSELEHMLRMRMLFSCLVDADYTASSGAEQPEDAVLDAESLLQTLYARMDSLREHSRADRELNQVRDQVFQACGDAGEFAPGLFTLTAPTGVGKTLSLLHFALRHCARHHMRRIILVLPFLALTEQSQQAYEPLIPDILADHSQSRLSESQRELSARWNAPFIITTSVRFFESLFSSQPKDCRKLHSIAHSVILFDEAQSLPADLMASSMKAAEELCRSYGCTMVFSTATQPELSTLPALERWQPREILPDGKRYYRALKRVQVCWNLDAPTNLDEIAGEMAQQCSTCTIVNLRRHAVQLFRSLKDQVPEEESESLFFLATDLCPAHRSAVISQIKARQREGLPCRAVATQCIEAGVDLDFQNVYRALAPLEAIIQAAGRCNRNGKLPAGGQVTVFIPEDRRNLYPGDFYQKGAEIVKIMWASGHLDIHDPDVIADYYRRLFHDTRDRAALTRAISGEDYETVQREYQLIRKQGVQVIVPYDVPLFQEIAQQAEQEGLTAKLIKLAAPITVSSYEEAMVKQHCASIRWHGGREEDRLESDFFLLLPGHEDCYQQDMGLQLTAASLNDERFMP